MVDQLIVTLQHVGVAGLGCSLGAGPVRGGGRGYFARVTPALLVQQEISGVGSKQLASTRRNSNFKIQLAS